MAVAQDASGSPHPWVTGDFVRKSRIIYGAEAVSPYRKGVQDLAYNANTLMARLRKPLATDAQDSTGYPDADSRVPDLWLVRHQASELFWAYHYANTDACRYYLGGYIRGKSVVHPGIWRNAHSDV